ncbi:MAG: type II toxin-antitoxin system VapC family toxin [Candidatus Delongbacteria bacterium]|nr:type II toxin-antitoxin system VapC family toxin [Candidatus Delongbacteria bacterium]MCG2760202.1 type II toxin-antitoxin system VapC family toxin [Candidatus Delongbacteria bacterium]
MKAIDTNVLVRFLVNDDPVQTGKVYKLFKKAEDDKTKLFIPITVFIETLWVLESLYKTPRSVILDYFKELLLLPILEYENLSSVQKFVHKASETNFGLADLIIGYTSLECGCEKVLTFDKKAVKSEFFELLK